MKRALAAVAALSIAALPATGLGAAFRQEVPNDPERCRAGAGPAVQITVTGVRASTGKMRVQLYRANSQDWLEKGRWIYRMEVPAQAGRMSFCMPVPEAGSYGIAVRHDINGNRKSDIMRDGGGMSNNPSINILNLGKPSYRRVAFSVGEGVTPITIQMRYFSGS